MGKTARWFRGLLAGKKKEESPAKEKKRWSFVKSFRDKERNTPPAVNGNERRESYRDGSLYSYIDGVDPNKHAIAVAAATAAVAEAAVAAAQAAAAVVRLTNSGRCTPAYVSGNGGRREDSAAVKIQSAFRGYLARRALRALKGLVKLQALVRGHIVRKQTADTMRRMQALVRAQVRARAGRAHISESPHSSSKSLLSHHPGPATPEKYERAIRTNSTKHDRSSLLKRNDSKSSSRGILNIDKTHMGWMEERSWENRREVSSLKTGPTDDERSDKILEIDTGKPQFNSKRRNSLLFPQHTWGSDRNSQSFTTLDSPSKDSTARQSIPSPSSGEVQSINPLKFPQEVDDTAFRTADNSPQFYSASSRPGSAKRGPFTPTKSDCSRSFLSAYSDHPNYMANTESFRAKVRSQSAPKQRPEFEKSNSTKRYSVHGFGDTRSSAQKAAVLHANFTNKVYPGSGRLDRHGIPTRSS
ncbi:hypothetical protein HHK36_001088 [Tetracentron sinense]|uniref:DUF4005 domain-containing protein n=1 Tax=Tetracentron sinense TaxID=13715 RepID=A0A834ZVE2_TETSI|nr:hypothetical protein HHK36_001088 [Tetracentron sinense]